MVMRGTRKKRRIQWVKCGGLWKTFEPSIQVSS